MVEQAKKQQGSLDTNGLPTTSSTTAKTVNDLVKQKQQDEENKIAKHIQEYQRALMKQQAQQNGKNPL